jgi:hypothetical protein
MLNIQIVSFGNPIKRITLWKSECESGMEEESCNKNSHILFSSLHSFQFSNIMGKDWVVGSLVVFT